MTSKNWVDVWFNRAKWIQIIQCIIVYIKMLYIYIQWYINQRNLGLSSELLHGAWKLNGKLAGARDEYHGECLFMTWWRNVIKWWIQPGKRQLECSGCNYPLPTYGWNNQQFQKIRGSKTHKTLLWDEFWNFLCCPWFFGISHLQSWPMLSLLKYVINLWDQSYSNA